MLRTLHYLFFCFFFILFLLPKAQAQGDPCECINCPVPIEDNGTFQGFLDVTVDGPNDLSQCPLQAVCFTITHTWVGDLSVALTSPGGLNYLVMADDNNNFGGCGTSSDDIEVCINVGTGNPLTNNAPYNCNGPNPPCLVGDWTVPCGGVTDPVSGATQAPNCDLNDFNLPGQPANGTWTLTINDICGADVGFLETWSLEFACGTLACIQCDAEGGVLNAPDVAGCQGDPALNLNINANYPPPLQEPDPADYGYTFVVTLNGIINTFIDGPNLSSLPPGNYQVCGLSYLLEDAGAYNTYIGLPYALLQNDLLNGNANFCGDLSDDCFQATIGPPIPPTIINTTLCPGDCFTTPLGQQCCTPGVCEYTLTSYLGCDSVIQVIITVPPPDITSVDETLCFGDCITVNNQQYCAPGSFVLELTNQEGCDSTVFLNLITVPVVAAVGPVGEINCSNPAVLLDGSGSLGTAWEWTDENGNVVANVPTYLATQGGCYTLTVFNTLNNVTCSDEVEVCVNENLQLPQLPVIVGPTPVCSNAVETYSITADPNADTYVWQIPPGAVVVAGGDGFPFITLDFSASSGGNLCVFGANGCGPGPNACLPITLENPPTAPPVAGPATICPDDVVNYSTIPDPSYQSYTWTVPPGATIVSGQGLPTIIVDWGNSGGGDVCLVVSNNCGDSPPTCFPVAAGQLPAQPIVVGPVSVCAGDTVNYSSVVDPLATATNWTVPSCATILSGQGTDQITVVWDNSCAGGDVCLVASNGCGDSDPGCLPVGVEDIPDAPVIIGPADVCELGTESYSVTAVPGAVDYIWVVTGGTIVSGQGTSSATVNWTQPGNASVCVTVENGCGLSPETCLPVTIGALPLTPVITGPNVVCDGSIVNYSTPVDPAATAYNWTVDCGVITAGDGTDTITVDWTGCPGGGEVCVTVETDCGVSSQICETVQGGTLPVAPVLNGPDNPCLGDTVQYCADPDPNAASYTWNLSGGTIVSGQATDCVEVVWNTDGPTSICATAENGCGVSPETCFDVNVETPPTAPSFDGPLQPCVGDTAMYQITASDPDIVSFDWSLSCGGNIVAGQGTDIITVVWDSTALCQVCVAAFDACSAGPAACIDVDVIAIPTPDAGADEDICGLSYTLNGSIAVGSGTWTASGPGNAQFDDPTDPNTVVTVTDYGAYTFTWSDQVVNCIGADDVVIGFFPDPVLDGIIQEVCTPNGQNFEVIFTITGGVEPYSVTGTVAGVLTGNTFTSDLLNSGDSYSFEVVDALGCGPLVISGSETCDCVSDAGTMEPDLLETCEDQTLTAPAPNDAVLDPDDTFEFILHSDNGTNGSTLGTIIDQNTTGTFAFAPGTMNTDEIYFISYVVGNDTGTGVDLGDDCTDIAVGQPVIWYEIPSPDAGGDDAVCGLDYTLSAIASVGTGTWSQVAGPGTAIFVDANDAASSVNVDVFGTYIFAWSEDNNGCTGSDEVEITFNDGPEQDGVTLESCNLLDFTFTVEFSITNGQPPYSVTGTVNGTVTGNTFVSDPIPSPSAYSFEVFDANGCGPLLVSGDVECICSTVAGDMDLTPVEVCEDATVTVPVAINTALDPEDILVYVLHNGPGDMLGTEIYDVNDQPTFSLVPPMLPGVTYYISAVAGNDLDGDGQIDTNDPCVDVAIGTPVVFTALPEASFVNGTTVCEGDIAQLELSIQSVNGCVDIEYELSDGTVVAVTCVNDGDLVDILTTDVDLSATILTVADEAGCTNTGSGLPALITVNLIPEATLQPTATICNSTDSGNSTVLDFNTLILAGDAGGSWGNTDGVVVTGSFPLLDFTGANPGTYTFTYTTNSALSPCVESVYTMEVTVEDCVCPVLDFLPASPICNDGSTLDLTTLQVENVPGTFLITGTPPGAVNLPQITGNIFQANNADPGVYEITFELGVTPPVGCPLSNTLAIEVSALLTAGQPNAPAEVCLGEAVQITLADLLQGADAGGAWTESSVSPSTGNAFDPANGVFNPGGQGAGTYTFDYTVTPNAPCSPDVATVEVIIHPLPTADAGQPSTLTCNDPSAQIGGASSSGAIFSYSWSLLGGTFPGDSTLAQPEINLPGTYELVVTNTQTGCTASDQVTILSSQEVPVPFFSLQPISCFGFTDGAILIDSVQGGIPPYLFSLNGDPFVSVGAFTNLAPDTYTIVVEDANGCQTEVFTFDIEQPQELNVELVAYLEGENVIRLGEAVDLEAVVNQPIDSIMWSPPGLVDCDTCLLVTSMPLMTTEFSVTVESNGCSDSDNLKVIVERRDIYAPNIFSPNGDGNNDVFFLGAGPEVEKIRSFMVFDRWGESVHQYFDILPNDPTVGWDGNLRGDPLNPAVFTWFAEVEFIDGRVEIYKGDVTLVR
jgi:gliding motility-associated-like protein